MKKVDNQKTRRSQLKQTSSGSSGRLESQAGKEKSSYSRVNISSDDLAKENTIVDLEPSQYKSTWASEIQDEMEKLARMSTRRQSNPATRVEEQRRIPENWEELAAKPPPPPKVRKPVQMTTWFTDKPEDMIDLSNTDSSADNDSQDATNEWKKIEKQKKRKQKTLERKVKRKEKMENVASKMKHLIGLGPIPDKTIRHFENEAADTNEALILASKEYLQYYLDFNQQELDNIKINEVKRAAKDSVIYIAVQNEADICEIHYRKTQARNNDLIIRDYIPSSYHVQDSRRLQCRQLSREQQINLSRRKSGGETGTWRSIPRGRDPQTPMVG